MFFGVILAQAGSQTDSLFGDFDLGQLPSIMAGLACYVVRFALILFGVLIIYAGIRFILTRGNPEGFKESKRNLVYLIIGGFIVYGVYTIILSLALLLTGSTDLSWIPLSCP